MTNPGTPYPPAPSAPPAPRSPALGRWAMGLGITALALGLFTAVGIVLSTFDLWRGPTGAPLLLGTLCGLPAFVLGIIAAVSRRGRKQALTGIWTAVGGAAAVLLTITLLMVIFTLGLTALLVDHTP
ncbi:hypothetical protein [Microbacterium sp. YY-01]|uniref:hypothetical protein n=1 Tax=Microbacterium sp. YY-01 TaxID=3421634 RepID=UPI003D180BC2